MEYHRDMAYSCVGQASLFLNGEMVNAIVDAGDDFTAYYEAMEDPRLDPVQDEEMSRLYDYWWYVETYFMAACFLDEDNRAFYVVVPREDELIYVWDVDRVSDANALPLERGKYTPTEKDNLYKVINGQWNDEFATYHEDAFIGTAMKGIEDDKGNVIAVAAMDVSLTDINYKIRMMVFHMVILLVAVMAIACLVYYLVLRQTMIKPLVTMKKATESLVDDLKNDTEKPMLMDIHTGDEIEALANSFEDMGQSLLAFIRESEAAVAEKEQVATEMRLAKRIQADMLPDVQTVIANMDAVDISASMEPAKAVGGDFYDCFFIDNDHLALVMADVAGKGVPAALFMMMAKILIKDNTMRDPSPARILTNVNEQICEHNHNGVFVTVWLGILNIKTGILKAANAGHEYPVVKEPDGSFVLIKDRHSFVIGAKKNMSYAEYEFILRPGSKLYLYTDGVPEAENINGERFGNARMVDALNTAADKSTDQILTAIKDAVSLFSEEAEQFDDITMLCLHYIGSGNTIDTEEKITVDAVFENIPVVTEFVIGKLEPYEITSTAKNHIKIVIDEIINNIAKYAYEEPPGPITVIVRPEPDNRQAYVTFEDQGIPCNPLDASVPDITLPAKERKPGGMGILMTRKIMDEVSYEYTDGKNILKVLKRW